jgi:hypothetical protein
MFSDHNHVLRKSATFILYISELSLVIHVIRVFRLARYKAEKEF